MADLFRLKQTRINVHPDVHRLTGCRRDVLAIHASRFDQVLSVWSAIRELAGIGLGGDD